MQTGFTRFRAAWAATKTMRHHVSTWVPKLLGLGVVTTSSATVLTLLLGARYLGWLQTIEVKTYDQLVRWQPDRGEDSRILIVGLTEADLKRYSFPISDEILAQVLSKLQQHQPRLIGLDIYRNLDQGAGKADLQKEFQADNLIAISLLGTADEPGIAPPPSIPPERIGFNDVVIDPDGSTVRRNLLNVDSPDTGDTLYSFSLRLALSYFAAQGITPQSSEDDPFTIFWGKATFKPLNKDAGGYQTIDDAGYQILLSYRTRGPVARQVSLRQVLEGELKPEWIHDRIVLIGATAPSLRDSFITPYSAAERENPRMPGVMLHGQMLSQLLDAVSGDRQLIRYWPEGAELCWIIIWTLLGGSVAWWLRHPALLGIIGCGTVSLPLVSGVALFSQGIWVPIATPALSALFTAIGVVAYRAQQAQRQQQMVMTLLGQNISPEIADALWASRDYLIKTGKLPGQSMIATMLFSDIKDFSTISEMMPPEDLLNWLNEYFEAMIEEILNHKGIINKFMGDGLMAVFGVPMARTTPEQISTDACQAVKAALAMGQRLATLNADWQNRNLPTVKIRAGIFTGPVVAGSLGGRERMEYGVIGDSVNVASRLESCEKDRQIDTCRILIAEETLNYLNDEFDVESWGPKALKGKHQLVNVYRVIGRRSAASCPLPQPNPTAISSQPSSDLGLVPPHGNS